jgi:gluconate 2-dehydrogenase gamma chain
MKKNEALSRRGFLQSAGAATGGFLFRIAPAGIATLAQAACSARDGNTGYAALGAQDARDFAAMAARILPTTDTPGAAEAGVIHFFDQAFASDMAEALPWAERELSGMNASLGGRFAELAPDAQDDALRSIESGAFFDLVRVMTLFGFFAMSRYGGNREQVGWNLIGFEGHHGAWAYPFGYYDAEASRDD